MVGPLIATKFHVPQRRSATVPRARLTDRLAGGPAKLTLVAAPAGFGKTTVVTEWLSSLGDDQRVAWLSLDARDDEVMSFWSYVIAALDVAVPGVGVEALELLQSTPSSIEAVLATLVNDLDSRSTAVVLVLDDFHVIQDTAVQVGMAFLVETLPANVRLVIVSRADPSLPLARLRARGELVEIRAADLRFTAAEASAYLNEIMGLAVHDEDVVTLGERTEGWIAALQLAALSMQGRDDAGAFIAGFAGDDRYVVDYLVEEVLERQPEAVRRFLLETSILSRLTGDLCDAVTGAGGGAATLQALDRANLFLVPLDDHREWYRYHHLFAEMLRGRLLDELSEDVGELHLRASDWFKRHDHTTEAIGHAIDAAAFDRAADMIILAMPAMQQRRQETTLVRWFEMLPAEIVRDRPALSIGFAGTLLSAGRTDGVEALLRDAESANGGTSEEIRAVQGGIALYRAAQALTSGDIESASEHARIAVELAEDRDHIDRGSATGLLALILWSRGDLADARASWAVSLEELHRAGHLSDMIGGSIAVADIQLAQGRLTEARETYRHALGVAGGSEPPLRGAADMHVGMSDLLRERDDLDGARRHLAAAEALGEYAGLPQNRHRRRMAAARLLQTAGDPAIAIPILDEAERLYTPDFFPDVHPIPALRARVQLTAGRKADTLDWVRRSGVTVDDQLSYLREFEHVTLVRVLLARPVDTRQLADASRLVERLLHGAEHGGRWGSVIELLVLQSITLHKTGRIEDAVDALARAVSLAKPEGYVRVFADEGEPVARLLAALAKRGDDSAYVRRLHAATTAARRPRSAAQGLVDPLSDRELDVLRLLGSELAGPEISRQLVISLNTLRTHTKNIYAKLGVTSRREAVRRATDLGIFRTER
ncbi:MAG: ATP-dependent transcriptional regulator, MalT-like, LuxR family [Schumannella sp.]|nr:ATP-dependent transcriptional regulator, MalT-like, LuxR family [Schumannella sp.]